MNMPTFKLNNGTVVPKVGFGTCKHDIKESVENVIIDAIDVGYRYIDTASFYETERDVGNAIKKSGIDRKEFTIATKLWYEELGYQNAKDACRRSIDRLKSDYIDIYFIHWPKAVGDDNWKKTLVDTWRAMEELKEEGLIKALAVSNFLPHHLNVIFENSNTKPVIDQLELHLGYFQEYAYRYAIEKGIQVQAWSPVGRGKEQFKNNKILNEMAKKYGVTVQKLSLKFLSQRDVMPLPWSTKKEHIKDNIDIFNFEISDEDMTMLSCMPQENWLGEHPDFYLPVAKHVNMNQ